MKQYHIAVLGPIPRDHITTHKGEVIEKYGCATHTTIGLSRLLGDKGTVYPVSHVRKSDREAVEEVFTPYSNVDTSYIRDKADQGDVIRLKFLDQNNRKETQTGFMNPIIAEDIRGTSPCGCFCLCADYRLRSTAGDPEIHQKEQRGHCYF